MVPCEPVKRLDDLYGFGNWETNEQVNSLYKFENLGSWPDNEWPNVNKFYDVSGKLIRERTLAHANSYKNSV